MLSLKQTKKYHEQGLPFIFFDTETTGLTPGAIVEIAAKKVIHGKVVGEFHSLVNAGIRMDSETMAVHGITMEMIEKEGRPPKEVLLEFYQWLGSDVVLSAHNLPFDLTFLNAHNQRDDIKPPKFHECCTLQLAKEMKLESKNNKLATIAEFYNINLDNTRLHRAMDDVGVLVDVFLKMIEWEKEENSISGNLFVDNNQDKQENKEINFNNKQITDLNSDCSFCNKCSLRAECTNVVTGQGGYQKRVMIVGEAPGKEEDKLCKPFCGRSGKVLEEMLENINWTRDDVYITNIVKCRPPENRDPKDEEKQTCSSNWLEKEIEILRPDLVVLLGRHSANYFLPDISISDLNGRFFRRKKDNLIFLPLYHPAVAVYSSSKKADMIEKFSQIAEFVKNIKK